MAHNGYYGRFQLCFVNFIDVGTDNNLKDYHKIHINEKNIN